MTSAMPVAPLDAAPANCGAEQISEVARDGVHDALVSPVALLPWSAKEATCPLGCYVLDDPASEKFYTAHRKAGTPRCVAANYGRSQALRRRAQQRRTQRAKRLSLHPDPGTDAHMWQEHSALAKHSYPCRMHEIQAGDLVRWVRVWYRVISTSATGGTGGTIRLSFARNKSLTLPNHRVVPTVREQDFGRAKRRLRFAM